jgi:hypothetical protein
MTAKPIDARSANDHQGQCNNRLEPGKTQKELQITRIQRKW